MFVSVITYLIIALITAHIYKDIINGVQRRIGFRLW